jgi:hypothetical protein
VLEGSFLLGGVGKEEKLLTAKVRKGFAKGREEKPL